MILEMINLVLKMIVLEFSNLFIFIFPSRVYERECWKKILIDVIYLKFIRRVDHRTVFGVFN